MSRAGKIIGQISEVSRCRGDLLLQWHIPGFLDLPNEVLWHLDSPHFSFSDGCWYMSLCTDWENLGRVCLGLHRDDAVPSAKTVEVLVGIVGFDRRRAGNRREFKKKDSCLWKDFVLISSLRKPELMVEGALTVTCNMTATARGADKALEDFASLLESGERSDITVQVGDVQFPVHSLILFTRCPALCVSLRHESREKASGKIVVEDCEAGVFRDFLHFLYTGSVRSLNKQNVYGLYRVADKYLADDLKRLCSEHMENTLSTQTFCDTVRLASMHGESDLLERAVSFATGNILSILRSEEWQNFLRECPTEANELLIKSLGPLCQSQTSKS